MLLFDSLLRVRDDRLGTPEGGTRKANSRDDPCRPCSHSSCRCGRPKEVSRSLRHSAPGGSCMDRPTLIAWRVHRARSASKLKLPPRVVRGRPQGPVGKPTEAVDESATGSVNPFLWRFWTRP